jgi:hypothetical protein
MLKLRMLVLVVLSCSVCALALPTPTSYISFEDSSFGGATYIDDQGGVAGDIVITAGGVVGNYGDFENPTTADTGDSLAVAHPGDNGTIAMWLNIDEDVSHYPAVWDASAAGNQWKTYPAGTNLYSRLSSSWQPAITAYTPGNWFHYAFSWSRNGATASTYAYINGVEAASIEQNWFDPAGNVNLGGAFSWYPKYNGNMDEAYIFDSALSAAEVTEVMNIPEPATMLVLGFGAMALRFRRRDKKA